MTEKPIFGENQIKSSRYESKPTYFEIESWNITNQWCDFIKEPRDDNSMATPKKGGSDCFD